MVYTNSGSIEFRPRHHMFFDGTSLGGGLEDNQGEIRTLWLPLF